MTKLLNITCIALGVIGVAGGLCVEAQTIGSNSSISAPAAPTFSKITPEQMSLLLSDVAASNPMALQRLKEDPDARQAQVDSLRKLLALASQAKKEGIADDPLYRDELNNIRDEVTAVQYDRSVRKAGTPTFSRITPARITAFWNYTDVPGLVKVNREARFELYHQTKLFLLKEADPSQKDRELTDEEKEQTREFYAKIQITVAEYEASKVISKELRDRIALQVMLQQAQFLARLYSEKLAERITATDAEMAAYVKAHSEFETSSQRRKANEILERAKAGEDFASLANEFSEDPGNKNERGLQGGLYKNVGHGVMVAPFEIAALKLQPGKIYPEVVESDFGFHVIKLERKGADTYDVRHILISTTMPNPDDPTGRPLRLKDYVKMELEQEKERQLIEKLVSENHISVPDDFVIPSVTKPVAPTTTKAKRPARKARQ